MGWACLPPVKAVAAAALRNVWCLKQARLLSSVACLLLTDGTAKLCWYVLGTTLPRTYQHTIPDAMAVRAVQHVLSVDTTQSVGSSMCSLGAEASHATLVTHSMLITKLMGLRSHMLPC